MADPEVDSLVSKNEHIFLKFVSQLNFERFLEKSIWSATFSKHTLLTAKSKN